jgi:hypothetical protein
VDKNKRTNSIAEWDKLYTNLFRPDVAAFINHAAYRAKYNAIMDALCNAWLSDIGEHPIPDAFRDAFTDSNRTSDESAD